MGTGHGAFPDSSSTGGVYCTGGRIPAFRSPVLLHCTRGLTMFVCVRRIAPEDRVFGLRYPSSASPRRVPPGRLKGGLSPGCRKGQIRRRRGRRYAFPASASKRIPADRAPAFAVPTRTSDIFGHQGDAAGWRASDSRVRTPQPSLPGYIPADASHSCRGLVTSNFHCSSGNAFRNNPAGKFHDMLMQVKPILHSATRARICLIGPLRAFTGNRIVLVAPEAEGRTALAPSLSAVTGRGRSGLFPPCGRASVVPAADPAAFVCIPPARRCILYLSAFRVWLAPYPQGTACRYPCAFFPDAG